MTPTQLYAGFLAGTLTARALDVFVNEATGQTKDVALLSLQDGTGNEVGVLNVLVPGATIPSNVDPDTCLTMEQAIGMNSDVAWTDTWTVMEAAAENRAAHTAETSGILDYSFWADEAPTIFNEDGDSIAPPAHWDSSFEWVSEFQDYGGIFL